MCLKSLPYVFDRVGTVLLPVQAELARQRNKLIVGDGICLSWRLQPRLRPRRGPTFTFFVEVGTHAACVRIFIILVTPFKALGKALGQNPVTLVIPSPQIGIHPKQRREESASRTDLPSAGWLQSGFRKRGA